MSTPYQPEIVEQAAQQQWDDAHSFEVVEDDSKEKFYLIHIYQYSTNIFDPFTALFNPFSTWSSLHPQGAGQCLGRQIVPN